MTDSQSDAKREFEELLKEKSGLMQENILAGDIQAAVRILYEIQDAREETLYLEVGRLTRGLHNAITNFHVDSEPSNQEELSQLSEMSDATDRLSHVVKMTETAANKTMDRVDDCMPIAKDIGIAADELRNEWQRLVNRDMSPEEFRQLYWRMDQFLNRLTTDSNDLYGHLSDILLAQDYQDLTGQLIQRVTGLVRDVEASLVDLMRMASKVEGVAGLAEQLRRQEEAELAQGETKQKAEKTETDPMFKGHGPAIAESEEVMSSQDDVDDLLSSLGF